METDSSGSGGTIYRNYIISYEQGTITDKSRISNIQKYGNDISLDGNGDLPNGSNATMLTFNWQDPDDLLFDIQDSQSHSGVLEAWSSGRWTKGDFNGDGLTDLLYKTTGSSAKVFFGNTNGTFNSAVSTGSNLVTTPWSSGGKVYWSTGDFDGDGLTDIFFISTVNIDVYLSNGDGTFADKKRIDHTSATVSISGSDSDWKSGNWTTGDFNGDGQTDLLFKRATGTVYLVYFDTALENASCITDSQNIPTGPWSNDNWVAADFNGDGYTDILNGSVSDFGLYTMNSNGEFNSPSVIYQLDMLVAGSEWFSEKWTTGDFNGDGFPDLLFVNSTNSYTYFNKGDGQFFGSSGGSAVNGISDTHDRNQGWVFPTQA